MMNEDNTQSTHYQDGSDGWKLYYSEEGYPYYYNEITGESQWAEYNENTEYQQESQNKNSSWKEYQSVDENAIKVRMKKGNIENETSSEEDEEDDSEAKSEESETPSEKMRFEEEFKKFLRTPEGIAAVLHEQERLERQIEKNQEKESLKYDAEYLKSLHLAKKSDGDNKKRIISRPLNVFDSIKEGFNVYLKGMIGPPDEEERKEKKKAKAVQSPGKKLGNDSKFDEYGRESKQRKPNREKSTNDNEENDIEQPSDENASDSVSKSGSSSDLVSLSSDDSDVETIKAPVLSEFGPFWNRIYSNYLVPTREFLDSSGITATTIAATDIVVQTSRVVLYNVATVTVSLATNIFSISGQVLQHGFAATGNQLYPHLVQFMENVIDGDQPQRLITNPVANLPNSSETTGDIHFTQSLQHTEENIHLDKPVIVTDEQPPEESHVVQPTLTTPATIDDKSSNDSTQVPEV